MTASFSTHRAYAQAASPAENGPIVATAPVSASEVRQNGPPVDPATLAAPIRTPSYEEIRARLQQRERGAARILNLNPSTLRSRMKNLGIKRPDRLPQPPA